MRAYLLSLGFVKARSIELAFAGLLPKPRDSHCCHHIGIHCGTVVSCVSSVTVVTQTRVIACTHYISNLFKARLRARPPVSAVNSHLHHHKEHPRLCGEPGIVSKHRSPPYRDAQATTCFISVAPCPSYRNGTLLTFA